jgi:hypothetical protein
MHPRSGATKKAGVDAPTLENWMGLAGAHRGMLENATFVLNPAVGGWFSRVWVYRPPPDTEAPFRKRRRWADALSKCGWIHTRPENPKRYFPTDVPAERRSSHASTTRFAMPASAALPQARGS